LRFGSLAMNLAVGILAAVVLAAALALTFENRLIFFPPRYPEGFSTPATGVPHLEEVWLKTSDGVLLNGYFLAAPQSSRALIWFHGNAENLGMGMARLEELARLDANLLAVDYRGYGRSQGSPDEAGVYRDGEAAYRYLTETRGFDAQKLFIYGHSLGGAVAVEIAARHPCGGLIVESSFTSIAEMARRLYRFPCAGFLPRSRFDSVAKIGRVRAPVLIIHGTDDAVVPFEMGRKLYEAAREPKGFYPVQGAAHDDPHRVGGATYLAKLREFMEQAETHEVR
jgi:fermentation-respiration switch protein FrsA (DUF1100 family)